MGAPKGPQRFNDGGWTSEYDLFLFLRKSSADPYFHWAFLKRHKAHFEVEIIYSWGAETISEHVPLAESHVHLRNPLATIPISPNYPEVTFASLPHHDNNQSWILHSLQQLHQNHFITTADLTQQTTAIQTFHQPLLIRSHTLTATHLERAGLHRACLLYLRNALTHLESRGVPVNDLTAIALPPGTGLTDIRASVTADIYVQWRLTSHPDRAPTTSPVLIPRAILYDTFAAAGWEDAMARAPRYTPDMNLSSITLVEAPAAAGAPAIAWGSPEAKRREIRGPESPAKSCPPDKKNLFQGFMMVALAAKIAALSMEGRMDVPGIGAGGAGTQRGARRGLSLGAGPSRSPGGLRGNGLPALSAASSASGGSAAAVSGHAPSPLRASKPMPTNRRTDTQEQKGTKRK